MEYLNKSFVEAKRSKFYGYLYKIDNTFEVEKIIGNLWKENKKANHIVYAYKVGNMEKKHEDKEPSNTAGKPILELIHKKNLDNTLIVVVRYFGGTLLGTGLLTRSYSKAASMLFK